MNTVSEASLSRVWQHTKSNRPIALITAFRGEYTREENLERNRSLASDVRTAGFGYFFVDGYWIENKGTANEKHVAEDSLFVIGDPDSDREFTQTMIKLGAAYDQEGVLIKTQEGAAVYFGDGSKQDVGELVPGKMAEIYTKLRRVNPRASAFVFESERDDLGWLQRLAGTKKD